MAGSPTACSTSMCSQPSRSRKEGFRWTSRFPVHIRWGLIAPARVGQGGGGGRGLVSAQLLASVPPCPLATGKDDCFYRLTRVIQGGEESRRRKRNEGRGKTCRLLFKLKPSQLRSSVFLSRDSFDFSLKLQILKRALATLVHSLLLSYLVNCLFPPWSSLI